MFEHDDVLVATADIVVQRITSAAHLSRATAMLDTQELVVGVPLVDESERQRLVEAADPAVYRELHDHGWHPIVAFRGDEMVGYASVTVPDGRSGTAVGDLVAARVPGTWAGILPRLLAGLDAVVGDEADAVNVWVRHVRVGDLAPAVAAGYRLDRRVGVLGRALAPGMAVPEPPPGTTVRRYVPDTDDELVVGILAAAYEGTPDGGWDLDRFRDRRRMPWFRPEDLILAVDDDGRGQGLHWVKRRDTQVGEVYNLAVHPDARGRRLSSLLLETGLAHLAALGHRQVILWVDRDNHRGVALYTSRGFTTRWDDVALVHTLQPGPRW